MRLHMVDYIHRILNPKSPSSWTGTRPPPFHLVYGLRTCLCHIIAL